MFYSNNLDNLIFDMHNNLPNVDELVIISGYLGPIPVSKLSNLPFDIKVYHGMYGESGMGIGLHNSLLQTQAKNKNIDILYTSSGVHSKCYIWKNNGQVVCALVGSANFSTNGLTTPEREVLTLVSSSAYSDLDNYSQYVNSISDNCANITLSTTQAKKKSSKSSKLDPDICKMSFLGRKGILFTKTGINWGNGKGNVVPGDGAIGIKKEYIDNYPFLFPPKQKGATTQKSKGKSQRHNDKIEIIWDDGTIMEGLLEGNQGKNILYPKQISSAFNKNIFGQYIRKRLGVASGTLVKVQDFQKYGRFDIDVSLLGAGVYSFDFSV